VVRTAGAELTWAGRGAFKDDLGEEPIRVVFVWILDYDGDYDNDNEFASTGC